MSRCFYVRLWCLNQFPAESSLRIRTLAESYGMDQFLGYTENQIAQAKKYLHSVVDAGIDFKTRKRFVSSAPQHWLDTIATEPLPEDSRDPYDLLWEVVDELTSHMPNFASPNFMGFPDAGNSLPGMAGAILAELLNLNLINSTFCSQTATEMEIAVIRWLRILAGYTVSCEAPEESADAGGMALTGGTLANFTAILLAVARAMPQSLTDGVANLGDAVVGAPEGIVHYTIRAGLSWAGLGSANLTEFPIRDYKYDLEALDHRLSSLAAHGRRVIMGVAYAGDSRTMTIDNLRQVSELYRRHFPQVWMHCDGCHGTSMLFSESKRSALDGIDAYDSITLDPHKVLNVPYCNSFLLLRQPADAKLIYTSSDLIMRQARSLGQTTPALGSKQFSSLRTWMMMKATGIRGIGEMIDRRVALACRFAELIDESESFIRLNQVNINSVVFIANPLGRTPVDDDEIELMSQVTHSAYERMLEDGRCYIHSFQLPDSRGVLSGDTSRRLHVFRFMSGNPMHVEDDLRRVLHLLDGYVCEEMQTRHGNFH